MLVKFPKNENTWNAVVVDSNEQMYVESEGNESFIVEYETDDDFFHALNRFDGLVEYEELV